MAEIKGNSELSYFDGRYRLLGLNNSIFNTNDLVEAELQMLESKATPLKNQKTLLTEEKGVWESFKKSMSNLADIFQATRSFDATAKKVTYSSEGSVAMKTSAGSLPGKYVVTVSQLAEGHQLASKDLMSSTTALGVSDIVKINGKELELKGEMSLRDIVSAVNAGDYGASASIISNRLILTSKNTGEANVISMTDGESNGLQSLGILADGKIANELKKAQDAIYTIDGVKLTSSKNEISSDLDGVSMTLLNKTTQPVVVEVTDDTQSVIAQIEKFVTAYNQAISVVQTTTDKGAYLQGQTLPLQFRRTLGEITNFVTGDGSRLFQAGLEIDGELKNGMLKLDKTKLEAALKENPEKIEKMFFGEEGVAKTMKDKINRFTSETGSFATAIEGLNSRIKNIDNSLSSFDASYARQKDSILAKYAAFETMMAGLNSQLSYMEAQLEALNGSKN